MIPSSEQTSKYNRLHEIDWQKFPSIVFESDDWGACESAATAKDAETILRLYRHFGNHSDKPIISTLENPAQLEKLYRTLEKFRGVDGIPPVFTAFVILGNPDFEKIRANGFTRYEDIGIDLGVPCGWEHGDIVAKWREGFERGIFHPEFHSTLHHTSPHLWLQRLREKGPKGELARALFDLRCYSQGEHLPEYHGMNLKEQYQWVKTGIDRFEKIFGFVPDAAITSDAFPETEIVWSLCGINVICLKNCRSNTGETVVYATKPWNMQDVYANIGDYDEMKDVVYMTRNAFFESGMAPSWNDSVEEVLTVVKRNIDKFSEPSIISTHRINYVSLDDEIMERRLSELEKLLHRLSEMSVHFLATSEVAQLYRRGWSARKFGDKTILRKWHEDSGNINVDAPESVFSLDNQRSLASRDLDKLPVGNYLLENRPALLCKTN